MSFEQPSTVHRPPSTDKPVLLFDGVCNLCNSSVQWVIEHDPRAQFRFASLQSEAGQALLRQHQLPTDELNTVVLVDAGRAYTRSDVPLQIVGKLGGAWPLLTVFRIVQRPLRNAVYDWIARNRYRWFGKKEACWLPTPDLKARFLA
jgi:predicted DCC family thiol-disulfide oxidoreductase YuxK